MNVAFLCLGGNLGDRLSYFNKAKTLISQSFGRIVAESPLYETDAWGSNSENKFLNQVIKISTDLSAQNLLKKLLAIEKKIGRVRTKNKNSDRIIDIDILFFNNEIIKTSRAEIPHPRLHLRRFVLKPLSDLAPDFVHPVLNKKISTLLRKSTDELEVKKYNSQHYICIEGNIGSGKTTLATQLAKELNASFLPEEFERNNLLPLFYKDPATYAFPLEYSFLLSRYQQLTDQFRNSHNRLVSDFSIYKCLWFAEVNLSRKDFSFFKKHFNALEAQLPKPDLIVYLHTATHNLSKNIRSRGRVYETAIKEEYLEAVSSRYIKGLKKLEGTNTLFLEIKKYDAALTSGLIKTIKKYLHSIS